MLNEIRKTIESFPRINSREITCLKCVDQEKYVRLLPFLIQKITWLAEELQLQNGIKKRTVIFPKGLKLAPKITTLIFKKSASKSGVTEKC